MSRIQTMPRLIYLATHTRQRIPKNVAKFVPQSDLINAVATSGLNGASVQLDIAIQQIQHLYSEGEMLGPGNQDEFKLLVTQLAMAELDIRREDFQFSDYLNHLQSVTKYASSNESSIIEYAEGSMNEDIDGEDIEKWDSGFEPFDLIMKGFYQGIHTIVGLPGEGKTSFMLSLMHCARKSGIASSAWFFENEIPLSMLKYKVKPLKRDFSGYHEDDRLLCGFFTVESIKDMIRENPDPNRIILFDGPDVSSGGTGEGKRFALEAIYRELVGLKGMCKAVIASSQAKRNQRGQMSMESVSDSFDKARYSDSLIQVSRGQRTPGGYQIRTKCTKNRFGPVDNEIVFHYNYVNMSATIPTAARQMLDEEEDW